MHHQSSLWFLLCCLLPPVFCICNKKCPPAEEGKSLTLYCSGSFAMNFEHLIWSSTNEGNTVATQTVSHCNKSMCVVYDKNKYSSSITTHGNTVTSMLKIHTVKFTERDAVLSCMLNSSNEIDTVMCCSMRTFVSPKSAKAPTCQVQLEWGNQINMSCHIVQTYPGISTYMYILQFPKEEYTSMKDKLECEGKPSSRNYNYYQTNCSALISVWSPGKYEIVVVVSPGLEGFHKTSNQNVFAITNQAQVPAIPSIRIQPLPEIKLCKHSIKPFVLICHSAWFPSPPRFRWYIDNSFISKGDIITVNQNSRKGFYFYESTYRYLPSSINFEKHFKCEAIYNTSNKKELLVFHGIKLRSVSPQFNPPYFMDHRGNGLGQLMEINQINKTIFCVVDEDEGHVSFIKIECWGSDGTAKLLGSVEFELVLPLNLDKVLFHQLTSCVCSASYMTGCYNSTTPITFLMKSKHPKSNESKQSYDRQSNESRQILYRRPKKSFNSPFAILFYIVVVILACLILITIITLIFIIWKRHKTPTIYRFQHPRENQNPTEYIRSKGSQESLSKQNPEDVDRVDQPDDLKNVGNINITFGSLKEPTSAHRTTQDSGWFVLEEDSTLIIHDLSATDIDNEGFDPEPPRPRPCRPDNSITHVQVPYGYQSSER